MCFTFSCDKCGVWYLEKLFGHPKITGTESTEHGTPQWNSKMLPMLP